MPSFRPPSSLFLPLLILLVFWARPTHAFGAGNIASTARIEGQNWRHGDIEDTLLTLMMTRAAGGKKFSKMDVKRVYFGNWLRDYSQAVDVGTVKMVSAEAIRILLWVLGFLSFGYGTAEFEVTKDRLGCYRPEDHIDNPKDYADNLDARDYDRRLRGPVDERRELSIDERTGLKNYIASEDLGITTSAGHVRGLFRRCIELARHHSRNGNKADFYEALRLLGTGLHCLEDYSAHSNYTELALIELGERDVFPHVGRRTRVQIRGARNEVYPLITGTFGGVDFLHSVLGEVSDKVTQSEIQELEGTISNAQSQQQNASLLKDLLNKLPDGLFGGKDEAGKANELQANAAAAQMQNTRITPREPEEWTRQLNDISKQIYPIMQYHDEIMQQITEAIDQFPVLPELIEQIQDQVSMFVFSLLAPFVLPIMSQVKSELQTGSSEIIQSSREKQHIVFSDDNCTDPTHSMLSKDHFSNILNEPAGRIASQVLKWAVPQIVECWDNENIDAERTINRIINGVFHHPALRDGGEDGARDGRQLIFRVVESWWGDKSNREKDDLRDKLSRNGVENGRNHKEGVHDSGHGCGKPLGMPKVGAGGAGSVGGDILGNILSGAQSGGRQGKQDDAFSGIGKAAGEAVGGGALGGLVGGLVGGVGASLLSGGFGDNEKKQYKSEGYNDDGSYTRSYGETGHKSSSSGEKYGKAQVSQTYTSGGRREEVTTYEQTTSYSSGGYHTEERRSEKKSYKKDDDSEDDDDDDNDDWEKKQKKERKKREKEEKKRREKEEKYGGGSGGGGYGRNDSDEEKRYKRQSGEHKRRSGEYGGGSGYGEEKRHGEGRSEGYGSGRQEQSSYGRNEGYGGGRQQESSYGRNEEYGGGRQQESGYGRSEGYGGRQEQSNYGRQEDSGYGRNEGYSGRQEQSSYGRQEESGYGRSEGYGGGGNEYGRGPPGGFGEEEYGEQRRDNYGERRGYGDGGYGGGGGY